MKRSSAAYAALLITGLLLAACSGISLSPATPPNASTNATRGSSPTHVNHKHRKAPVPRVKIFPPPAHGRRHAHDYPYPGALEYFSGPVQVTPAIYVVFWGFDGTAATDPDGVATRVTNFLNHIGGSNWIEDLTQYYESGPVYMKNPSAQLKGTWYDTVDAVPSSPTQDQVGSEAAALAAHFGIYSNDADYVVVMPKGHDPAGFGTEYCANHSAVWHDWTGDFSTSTFLAYTNLPYTTDASCGTNFVNGGSAGTLDGVTIVLGHELAESQTDPYPTGSSPYGGWDDGTTQCGGAFCEVADKCAWQNLQNTGFGGTTLGVDEFPTQPLWSNATLSCVQPPPPGSASPTPSPTATPSPEPTATPSPEPTATPSSKPTPTPSPKPTAKPTPAPTLGPIAVTPAVLKLSGIGAAHRKDAKVTQHGFTGAFSQNKTCAAFAVFATVARAAGTETLSVTGKKRGTCVTTFTGGNKRTATLTLTVL